MRLIPKYKQGDQIRTGTTVTNHYGDKTHYLPVSKSKEKDIDYNVGLPDITITPKNNLNLESAVSKGKEKFLKTAGEIATPIITGAGLGALGAGFITAPLMTLGTTGLSIGGGYIGGKIGERFDNKSLNKDSNYKTMGQLLGGSITGLGTVATPRLIAGDAYTTVGGKFGYYGNPLERVTGTLGRRFNWNTKAKSPELMRKLREPIKINTEGNLQVTPPNPRFDKTITNFTTDRPVVSHGSGNWDEANLYIFDPKITKGLKPTSIEPSDTFFVNSNITAKPSQTTLVSGNKSALIDAKSKGMSTLSSRRLRDIYSEMNREYLSNLAKYSKMSPIQRKLAKTDFKNNVSLKLKTDYANELQRLQTKRGTPTAKDYRLLETKTGLDAGVVNIKELNPNIFDNILKERGFMYPNGRPIDVGSYWKPQINSERKVLFRKPYNKVFYDPSTGADMNFRLYGNTHDYF